MSIDPIFSPTIAVDFDQDKVTVVVKNTPGPLRPRVSDPL